MLKTRKAYGVSAIDLTSKVCLCYRQRLFACSLTTLCGIVVLSLGKFPTNVLT